MKKRFIILCSVLTVFGLMAFGYLNLNIDNPVDLEYNIDSRFRATITKKDLNLATSVLDIVPKVAKDWWKVSFQTVTVAILQNSGETQAPGEDKQLNAAQISLLRSADYSTNFYIKARSTTKHPETGRIEDYVYYFTIVPEQEANYADGNDALLSYLNTSSKNLRASIEQDKLDSGRIYFTVAKTGDITNVKLDATCGYPLVDEALVKLVNNLPGKWHPATNPAGEKVNQELVLFFGRQGC